jgi:hypothetical protein
MLSTVTLPGGSAAPRALQPPCSAAPCSAAPVLCSPLLCSLMRRPACLGRQAPQACCRGGRRARRPRDDGRARRSHALLPRQCSQGNAPRGGGRAEALPLAPRHANVTLTSR